MEKESDKNDNQYGLGNETLQALSQALELADSARIISLVSNLHAADIADYIEQLDSDTRKSFVLIIKDNFDPEILANLESELLEEVTEIIGVKKSAEAISQLDSEDAAHVVEELQDDEQTELIEALPAEYRASVIESLSYPEESVGRIMRKKFVSVPEYWSVGQVIDYLRVTEELPEDFHDIYIVDSNQKPLKYAVTSRILRNKRPVKVSDIGEDCEHLLTADADQEKAAYLFQKYALVSAPIVDANGKMIGVLDIEDIVEIIQEEAEEDFLLLGGIQSRDTYMALGRTVRARFPWLWVSMLSSFVSAMIVSQFSETITKVVALAALMPVVSAVVGNGGMQTLSVVICSLVRNQVNSNNRSRVIIKEIMVCMLNGLLLGISGGVGVLIAYRDAGLASVFGVAMAGCFIIAGFVGAFIPMMFKWFKIDPAIASSAFVATTTDIVGFSVFLGLASMLLVH